MLASRVFLIANVTSNLIVRVTDVYCAGDQFQLLVSRANDTGLDYVNVTDTFTWTSSQAGTSVQIDAGCSSQYQSDPSESYFSGQYSTISMKLGSIITPQTGSESVLIAVQVLAVPFGCGIGYLRVDHSSDSTGYSYG